MGDAHDDQMTGRHGAGDAAAIASEEEAVARRPVLAVMARRPVRGAVKRRLAAHIGDDAALAVYLDLLTGTLDQAERLEDVELVLAAPPGGGDDALGHGAPEAAGSRRAAWRPLVQAGAGLGERLANVLTDLFASGAPGVVAINSDSPPIPLEYLQAALTRLAPGRLVLGPAADGGYYVIACDAATWSRHGAALAALLRGSPMSTPRLLAHTLREARAIGLEAVQLPLWIDVDGPDGRAVAARLAGAAPLRADPAGLREVYLHVTHRCARACRHCYDGELAAAQEELSTAEWLDVIDACAALNARSFVFIGGDPLLRADLVTLIDRITGEHGGSARFFFNSLIAPETAAELARVGRGRLTPLASIDGPRHINDAIRGPGSHDAVMASVAALQAAGLEPVANTVLVRPALAGLTQLARELVEAGVRRLHLILPHQQGLRGDDLLPSGAELLTALREVTAAAAEVGLFVDNLSSWRRRLAGGNDLCAAGCRDLAVDPYGAVHACVITSGDPAFVAGSVRERPLAEIWRESPSLRLLRASRARDRAACRDCSVVDACGGDCWVQSHYAARARGDAAGYAAPSPYCDLLRPLFEELMASAQTARRTGPEAGERDYALFDCI
jgi:mycofactocin biosynthetic radical S-adenosylmethionine protein MftC